MGHVKNKIITMFGIVTLLMIISIGLLIINQRNIQFASIRKEALRPATIENVVLRIESNIMRVQAAMEDLVFSEYASDLIKKIKAIDQLDSTINKDFEAMGRHFLKNNTQHLTALGLFHEWKAIRDKIIRLTKSGQTASAKKIVRGESAEHAMETRTALMELNNFSKKRTYDFDSVGSKKN